MANANPSSSAPIGDADYSKPQPNAGQGTAFVDQVNPELIGQKDGPADSDFDEKTGEKYEIQESDCPEKLGYAYPTWKKWSILTGEFLAQEHDSVDTS